MFDRVGTKQVRYRSSSVTTARKKRTAHYDYFREHNCCAHLLLSEIGTYDRGIRKCNSTLDNKYNTLTLR